MLVECTCRADMATRVRRSLLVALSCSMAIASRARSIDFSARASSTQPLEPHVQQRAALLAFKASGGAHNVAPLESWTANGTGPCAAGGAWAGVSCSGPNVTALDLGATRGHHEFENVAGDVGALAALVQLTRLDLNSCFKAGGQVAVLASLVHLTTLNLADTAVAGDIKSL